MSFSSLIIGIWAAAVIISTYLKQITSFQFPHHRDLGCSSGKDRARDSSGDSFQFPHHRDLGCSAGLSSLIISKMKTFSSLIIGIWAAALLFHLTHKIMRSFQFPHHRDLGCSSSHCWTYH